MMAHPAPVDIAEARALAVAHWRVEYQGKSAHAGAYPEHGVNAADASTIAQVAIGVLRQHLPSDVRVHGFVTRRGDAPNAIAGRTVGRWYVRAATLESLLEVGTRVRACFEAGARATGCDLTIRSESDPYADFRTDRHASTAYRANAEALGRVFDDGPEPAAMGLASTDMANVSHVVPAIHPYVGVDRTRS